LFFDDLYVIKKLYDKEGVFMQYIIIVGILGILLILVVGKYNKLITLRNRVKNAWSQIDVRLQERNDLIPNLVNVVKGYAKHESETLSFFKLTPLLYIYLNRAISPEQLLLFFNSL